MPVKTCRSAAKPPDPPFIRPQISEHHSEVSQPDQRGVSPPKMELGPWASSNARNYVNPYIREDLKSSQKVSADCFAEAVFGLTEGRLTTWADEIRDLSWFDDKIIRASLAAYCSTETETERYEPFTKLTNHIMKLARGALTDVPATYPVNDFCIATYDRPVDRIEEQDGLGAVRKPDALGLRNSVAKKLRLQEDSKSKKATVQWIDILLLLEFKAKPGLLRDRLNEQRQERGLNAVNSNGTLIKPSRKKKASRRSTATARTQDRRRGSTVTTSPVEDNILAPLQEQNQYPISGGAYTQDMAGVEVSIQAASYALELLSCTYGTRLYCLSMTVKDDTIHLWYYDASGIVCTKERVSIIDDFERFAAIIVGFACCTPEQFGVLPEAIVRPHIPHRRKFPPASLDESTLTIPNPHTNDEVAITLDESIFTQYILVGKRTFLYTIETDPVLSKKKLIMKLSYQVSTRRKEHVLVDIAKKAKVGHLPQIYLWGDLWKLSDGARDVFFEKSKQQAVYEDRVLRAIVYTRYSSIRPLFTDNCLLIPVMVDQMLDCLHDLRYKANILHRDISVNNIMYEKRGDYYHFILIDFDMAAELPKGGPSSYVATSKHRTGTLPFMAHELIADADNATRNASPSWVPIPHLLCHDLQSLFWVVVWCVLVFFRHLLDKNDQEKILRFIRILETGNLFQIASIKANIARSSLRSNGFSLAAPTLVLQPWLRAWTWVFMDVANAQTARTLHAEAALDAGHLAEPFDEETIGGTFTRQTLKDALTPHMPFRQVAIDGNDEEDIMPEIQDNDPSKTASKSKPRQQTRKRARPPAQVVAAENDIRARLRPRRKLA